MNTTLSLKKHWLIFVLFAACSGPVNNNTIKDNSTAAAGAVQQTTTAGAQPVLAFAFANQSGTEVLLPKADTGNQVNAAAFTEVIIKNTQQHCTFVKQLPAGANDNGRQLADNFAQSAGAIFKLQQPVNTEEETVLLTNAAFLQQHHLLDRSPAPGSNLSAEVKAQLESSKRRRIKSIHAVAGLAAGAGVYLVEFERKLDSVLVSLVATKHGDIISRDYAAKFDSTSTWGVDDGGEFGFDNYHLLAAFDNNGDPELVTEWAGAEGITIEYMVPKGNVFVTRQTGYRYSAPL
ncbi:hypothetical protein [Deminuibacter soli]|uniref:Uncharacterized protein n=1 Tax=Deminuibacter soli TaxID=2291815 RepID=A0A3E1NQ88_9BACT|nr:hypothetical protein [Deminuibacter soli]RFM30091.1 hypothetical protein DXN05_03710 [Deminuibacter soli]